MGIYYTTPGISSTLAKRAFFQFVRNSKLFNFYAWDLQELLTTIISIIVAEIPSEEGSISLIESEGNMVRSTPLGVTIRFDGK